MSTNPTLSADWYIDPEIYAHERQSVFGDSWVHVGYDSDIPKIGDVLSESVAEVEIEVVRTQSGLLVATALTGSMNHELILVDSFRGIIFVADFIFNNYISVCFRTMRREYLRDGFII